MTIKIAIIDFLNQDIGLSILFPEADYFILEEEFDRTSLNIKHNILPIVHKKHVDVFEFVNSDKYNTVFIIAPLYDALKTFNNKEKSYCEKTYQKFQKTIEFITQNTFSNIHFFDNYDYDYDPNILFDTDFIKNNQIRIFKRYYNSEKIYKENVHPFPYIIFGHRCNIDMLNDYIENGTDYRKETRIFFAGNEVVHIDPIYEIVRNRRDILHRIKNNMAIYNPGHLPYDRFLQEMRSSKYSLDLLGVGDPNIRTYEILSSGSLRLGQRSNLKWTFTECFAEETIFDDENDLLRKISNLENTPGLYETCLKKQNSIVKQYMNKQALRSYIMNHLH